MACDLGILRDGDGASCYSYPMVAAQSAPLLASRRNVAQITADLRDPDALLGHPAVRSMIDFTEPAGLLMTAVLQFVADDRYSWGLLARYVAALAPGSYLALSHATPDGLPPLAVHAMVGRPNANATEQLILRPRAGGSLIGSRRHMSCTRCSSGAISHRFWAIFGWTSCGRNISSDGATNSNAPALDCVRVSQHSFGCVPR